MQTPYDGCDVQLLLNKLKQKSINLNTNPTKDMIQLTIPSMISLVDIIIEYIFCYSHLRRLYKFPSVTFDYYELSNIDNSIYKLLYINEAIIFRAIEDECPYKDLEKWLTPINMNLTLNYTVTITIREVLANKILLNMYFVGRRNTRPRTIELSYGKCVELVV